MCGRIIPQELGAFHNLTAEYVTKCESFKSLFPVSISRELIQLEKLEVKSSRIEEIVLQEEETEEMIKFVFPNLTTVVLTSLFKLRAFYGGIHALGCQSLKKLARSVSMPEIGVIQFTVHELS